MNDTHGGNSNGSNRDVRDDVLATVNDIVLDAAEAVYQLAEAHATTHAVMSAHLQELAETLAGSTLDWISRWPA